MTSRARLVEHRRRNAMLEFCSIRVPNVSNRDYRRDSQWRRAHFDCARCPTSPPSPTIFHRWWSTGAGLEHSQKNDLISAIDCDGPLSPQR